jgi:hypothetical protein
MTLATPTPSIANARRAIKRAAGDPYLAEVMADNGEMYLTDNPGYIWVREILSHDPDSGALARGQAYEVRATAAFIPAYGTRVRVVYDQFDDAWEIDRQDFSSMVENGLNPAILNWLNPYTKQIDMLSLPPLRSYAVSDGATATTEVGIKNLIYLDYMGQMVAFKLSNSARPDIADYAPAANLKRLVHLWLDVDGTIAVSQSTAKDTALEFTISGDLAEVMNAAPNQLALPIGAWKIENGQTSITAADLWEDTRQWINVPQAGGFPNPVATNWLIPSEVTVTHAGSLTVTGNLCVQGSLVCLDELPGGSGAQSSSGGITDHGLLNGLVPDDDHTQYSIISSAADVPAGAPTRLGAIYGATTTGRLYMGIAGGAATDQLRIDNHPIASTSLTSNAASLTLSTITADPNECFGWRLVVSGLETDKAASYFDGVLVQFNSDTTAANYDNSYLQGAADAGATADYVGANAGILLPGGAAGVNADAGISGMIEMTIYQPQSASDKKHVSFRYELPAMTNNEYVTGSGSGVWETTDAITSITILPQSGTTFEVGNANEPTRLSMRLYPLY